MELRKKKGRMCLRAREGEKQECAEKERERAPWGKKEVGKGKGLLKREKEHTESSVLRVFTRRSQGS